MPQFSKETTAEEVSEAFSSQINGRTFLITGTSVKGLGARIATTLAKHSPAQLILVSRNKAKVDPVVDEIESINPQVDVKFVPCELSDQDSVRKAAGIIMNDSNIKQIDVVINNAGVMAITEYKVDNKGNELQLSSNHIGHFLLTNLIMPKILAAGPGARIVNHTSYGHHIGPFRFHDPNFSGGKEYDSWSAYGQSKTANILFSVELSRRLKNRQVQAYAVHPGLIMSTSLGDHMDFMSEMPALLAATSKNNPDVEWKMDGQVKTDSQGSASALVAALDPGMADYSGSYIDNCAVGKPMAYAVDPVNSEKLWAYSEEVVGQKFNL
ncbi:Retinol dehydrogenase 11 [Cytospora mali]|uniref:Retinol dehydrogenase 11 n=1 Tax=Cytospora mali TaxID=578113 RepID=A0A194W5E2_CYTMA|nr:Retinol dehydrogenase 11 [Valsa mali]